MDIFFFSVMSQALLTLYFAITHWINLYPFNDRSHVSFQYEPQINILMHGIQILSIYGFAYKVKFLMILGILFWSLWLVGHVVTWWVPYIFGASAKQIRDYQEDFGRTYKFLPSYTNHPAPDACHTILGILTLPVLLAIYMAYFKL